jgi:two-component system, OmpR family, response regulator CpxR
LLQNKHQANDTTMNAILLIDDDVELCRLLNEYLASEGFLTTFAHDADNGIRHALSGAYSFVILDVMLPGSSGFEVLRAIRRTSRIPVLMLTARGEDVDRIVGLEMGADDYLGKPFNPRELVARIRAVQRRIGAGEPGLATDSVMERLIVGDLRLEPGTQEVYRKDASIAVTTVEFTLLYELLHKVGRVVSREDLAVKVLGRPLSLFDRSIDVHISSLRKKLGRGKDGIERIKSIRGVGYLYTHPSENSELAASR